MPSSSVKHVAGASCTPALIGSSSKGFQSSFGPGDPLTVTRGCLLQKGSLRAALLLATPETPQPRVPSSSFQGGPALGPLCGRDQAGLGADASASRRCWDLSSGNKKWIIQVPILASIVVSRGGPRGGWGHGSQLSDQLLTGTYGSFPGPQGHSHKA